MSSSTLASTSPFAAQISDDGLKARRLLDGVGGDWRATRPVRELLQWIACEEAATQGGASL